MTKQFYIWTQEDQHSETYYRTEQQAKIRAELKGLYNYEIREIYTR